MSERHDAGVYWAHRLHATVLNSIGAAILQSQVCEQAVRGALPSSIEELVRLRRMLTMLEEEARALAASAARRGGGTLHGEVAAAVRAARAEGLPVRVRMQGRGGVVPRRVARGAAVVLAEALANAARHAQASSVEVDVTVRDGMLILRVRDDGRGCAVSRLEPAPTSDRRCGVIIMRAQAGALGGRVEFSSAPARGTQVSLFVPLPVPPSGVRALPDGATVTP